MPKEETRKMYPSVPPSDIPHFVYRIWGESGELLYIGMSYNVKQRMVIHKSAQPWAHEIFSVTQEEYQDRPSALRAETEAIVTENPLYNKAKRRASSILTPVKNKPGLFNREGSIRFLAFILGDRHLMLKYDVPVVCLYKGTSIEQSVPIR